MTTLASRLAPRGLAARDLAAMWLTFAALFAYLDVPLQHAPLFATNLVFQAALGGIVLTLLLRGVEPSLLLLCGPGLILGGALSFAIFQVVGRGEFGSVVTVGIGLTSLLAIVLRLSWRTSDAETWRLLGQVTGMAMLALCSEFSEFAPVALLLLLLGFSNCRLSSRRRVLTAVINVVGIAFIAALSTLRQDFWWLVTDDYHLLEVIARHVTASGPRSLWGVNDFARYHWLSYGWSGLLDRLSGSPQPFVTLTRVMPVVYSMALASSLILLYTRLNHRRLRSSTLIPVWTVIAVGYFDWTGTSTGGVYAALAAIACVGLLAIQTQTPPVRSLALVGLLACIIALTKFPSLVVVYLTGLAGLLTLLIKRRCSQRSAILVGAVTSVTAIPMALMTVWVLSKLLDERFAIAPVNPGLGQLSTFGRPFTAWVLIMSHLWLWISAAVLLVGIGRTRNTGVTIEGRLTSTYYLALVSCLALITGLFLELTISSNADAYKYFSGPMYFVASLSFLLLGVQNTEVGKGLGARTLSIFTTASCIAAGLFWGVDSVARAAWNVTLGWLFDDVAARVDVLTYFTRDWRVGTSFAGGTIAAGIIMMRREAKWIHGWMTALLLISIFGYFPQTIADYRKGLPQSEIDVYLGSPSERAVGLWLESNSGKADLIATNHSLGNEEQSSADFSLAVWSNREFLVLGPNIGPSITSKRTSAIEASISFAKAPGLESCQRLIDLGVRWFIVDRRLVSDAEWSVCSRSRFESGSLQVLELTTSGLIAP